MCQFIYWNLLNCMAAQTPAEYILREFRHTLSCDQFHDLQHVRNRLEQDLSSAVIKQVFEYTKDEKIHQVANSYILNRSAWLKEELYQGLTIPNKVYFHTRFPVETWLARKGILLGTVDSGLRMAFQFAKQHKQEKE
jgi:hypothetical protein